jgi:hypothetical protein
MEVNVRQVRTSDHLAQAAAELAERAVDLWTVLDAHRAKLEKPMERSGRKAQPLDREQQAEEGVEA